MNIGEMIEETRRTWKIDPKSRYEDRDVAVMYSAMALGGEIGELQNMLTKIHRKKYYTDGHFNPEMESEIPQEMADILYFLLRLSDTLGVDLERAFMDKMGENRKRYLQASP